MLQMKFTSAVFDLFAVEGHPRSNPNAATSKNLTPQNMISWGTPTKYLNQNQNVK